MEVIPHQFIGITGISHLLTGFYRSQVVHQTQLLRSKVQKYSLAHETTRPSRLKRIFQFNDGIMVIFWCGHVSSNPFFSLKEWSLPTRCREVSHFELPTSPWKWTPKMELRMSGYFGLKHGLMDNLSMSKNSENHLYVVPSGKWRWHQSKCWRWKLQKTIQQCNNLRRCQLYNCAEILNHRKDVWKHTYVYAEKSISYRTLFSPWDDKLPILNWSTKCWTAMKFTQTTRETPKTSVKHAAVRWASHWLKPGAVLQWILFQVPWKIGLYYAYHMLIVDDGSWWSF